MGEQRPAYLQRISDFVAGFRSTDAPAEVRDHARLVLLDTLGAILAGSQEEPVRRLLAQPGVDAAGPATILGHAGGHDMRFAAFVNGTAGTWCELDEGNHATRQHPAIHVLPAALAVAEHRGSSGQRLLEALIVGYEVGGRIGMATRFRDDVMHPHGTHGTLGGAAAVAKVLELAPDLVAETLNVASSMTVATSRKPVFQGGTVRHTYCGQASQNAVLAGFLVTAGVTGEQDGPGHVFGNVSGESFDPDVAADGLGQRYQMLRSYFKLFACCAYNHATLNALAALRSAHHLTTADVERVDVTTYFPATRMVRKDPQNDLAAKFSLPYCVATMLVRGDCDVEAFRPPALGDDRVVALAQRVEIHEDPEMTAAYPHHQGSRTAIRLRDGRVLESEVRTVRGDYENPVHHSVVEDKFRSLAGAVLGEPRAEEVFHAVSHVDRLADVRELTALLRPGAREPVS